MIDLWNHHVKDAEGQEDACGTWIVRQCGYTSHRFKIPTNSEHSQLEKQMQIGHIFDNENDW